MTGKHQGSNPPQAFVKFFGNAKDDRASISKTVLEEIDHTGGHQALCYSPNGRAKRVGDGAIIFIARLVVPKDIQIFGRAVAIAHVPGKDEASEKEKKRHQWKRRWPVYVRVRNAEFVSGTLENGVSLYELMDMLKHRSFASTLRNFNEKRGGNINPRSSIQRHPDVQLTQDGLDWLETRLQEAFNTHGRVPQKELDKID